jgi:hypothetical protein
VVDLRSTKVTQDGEDDDAGDDAGRKVEEADGESLMKSLIFIMYITWHNIPK